jgi:hypothetical protein
MLQLEYEPHGLLEKAGSALGMVDHRTKADLERFRDFVEHEGLETGAWRGEVRRGETVDDPAFRTR